VPAALGLKLAQDRHNLALDRLVESEAIVRRVIKSAPRSKSVIAVVAEAGIASDLLSELQHLLEDLLELLQFLQPAVSDKFPGLLAERPVRLFQVTPHLRERLFLAAEIDGERSAQLLVLLAQFGFLGFQRDVFGTVRSTCKAVFRSKTS
jgi:hypothetical protein